MHALEGKRVDIRIYVSCHRRCRLPQNRLLYPVQVGTALSGERFPDMFHDDEGENISAKNPGYCELTAQYWAWKNQDAAYYGFFHYRRYMSFSDIRYETDPFQEIEMPYLTERALKKLALDEETMAQKICQYDVIATVPVKVSALAGELRNNLDQYTKVPYQYQEDIDVLLEIIQERYPAFYKTAHDYFYKGRYGYYCNMFIMEKELFHQYSEWLFTILSEHEKRRDYSGYTVDGRRVSGYLGERLFGIYYMWLKKSGRYRTCELQRALFLDVEVPEQIKPAFGPENVPVVIAANDYYAPYISTLLLSIREHASYHRSYDILILSHDITEAAKARLRGILAGHAHFSLRFIDPGCLLDGYDLYVRGHFSVETYYRLLLPEMLLYYDKVVYLDVDMIVLEDLAALYDTDVEGFLLAAAYDPDTAGLYNGFQQDKKVYMDKELALEDPYRYFQAGTLVMNLRAFRETFTTREILDVAVSKKWQLLDQDILNCLCEHRVKELDMSWNVMYDYAGIRINKIIRLAPEWLYLAYQEARKHPKIIHYAGPEKPWHFPESDFADIYWAYARKTPYYETMLYRMSCYAAAKEMQERGVGKSRRKRSLLYRTIRCLFLYGPAHTLAEIRKGLKIKDKGGGSCPAPCHMTLQNGDGEGNGF